MPTVSVSRDRLFAHLGRSYTDREFDELCFEFGIELDDVTSERIESTKSEACRLTEEQICRLSDEVIYKIDVPANRYDLLCVEGISTGLRVFLGDVDAPRYDVLPPAGGMDGGMDGSRTTAVTVMKDNVDTIRPYVVCAILRDVTFDEARYDSFIELQDHLHRNVCRGRTLVAIGTHDLDGVVGPFVYDARPPRDFRFVPLTHAADGRSFDGAELLDHYESDPSCKHLRPYLPIIRDSDLYPVVMDSTGEVMSLPPVINGAASRITLNTRNVFVECTATDMTKANIVLDTIVAMFSGYSSVPFSVESVIVNYVDGDGRVLETHVTPRMESRKMTASVGFVNSLIGINLDPNDMATLCDRVQLGPARVLPPGGGGEWEEEEEEVGPVLEVTVPPTRSDILHAVDVAEDVGIAHGYNKIARTMPQTCTVGREQPLNQLGDLLREEIGRGGYVEVLTHGLSSRRDNFGALRRQTTAAVSLSNPANVEYEVVRTTLLPGLLKCLQHNRSMSFASGLKLFEVSDVVLPDDAHVETETIVGARNVRRVCATYTGPTSGFEVIHGLVDRIMTLCEVSPTEEYVGTTSGTAQVRVHCREGWYYGIRELREGANDEVGGTYFPGRAAEILLSSPKTGGETIVIGTFGILHPEVLGNFDIMYPTSAVELNLDPLL